jgi:hypothetical protein
MKKKIGIGAVLVLLVAAASASAFHVRVVVGNLVVDAEGGFSPKALPKHENAPITAWGGGKISTLSGELPPVLESIRLEFDRHGVVDTEGLPHCTKGKLVATTVPVARRACGDAIIGKGFGSAVVAFPEQGPIKVGSPITLFNGPKKGGDDTIIAHAHLDYPGPTTFIVPIVIERIHKGVFGYRVNVQIPKIAGGYGHPIAGRAKVGRMWTFKGRSHSYINARCETGQFRSRGQFTFKDENKTVLKADFFLPCQVRK